ncbi:MULTISPECIES: LysR family transcriptional regulator [unclassified Duganella]|uniref:LysR family transcriptional regulator n=1 Tax=unclassified Duganella TaxID=2636909 RepID=UPI0008829BF0|nr:MULTISPECIES: LysR family transcriptional regulator [unclassified Duganella]SDG97362.1 LysR family transcriptional regulator, regulator for bpeEF and oprC [Duganella sp. OV458]SDJ45099.1 transcriptional regulator, LysR family [Duganella sp. OV510]
MDRLKAMQTFVRIVEANSFTKAAETLDLPRAALTATIKKLEAFLGTQLLQRTTRRLSLTPDGADYYRKCQQILQAVEDAESIYRSQGAGQPRGKLRVELPGTFGRNVVLPHIGDFCRAYPDIDLVVSLSDRVRDLTEEGADCALRVGALQDSAMIGRPLGSMRFVTCAAPAYLQQHGVPQAWTELREHRCVAHFSGRTGRPFDWDFIVDGSVVTTEVRSAIAVNDAEASASCALQGLGLAQLARYQVRPHLASGALVEVLASTPPTPMPLSLLYPQGRMSSPRLRVFADWLAQLLRRDADLQAKL